MNKQIMGEQSARKCLLLILDGWGIAEPGEHNAISLADTPFLDRLKTEYPGTRLHCSGTAVGLPEGIMGNSEVGHLNIGAGRVVYQALLRIDVAIEDGSFFENQVLKDSMERVKSNGSALHLMGLVSDGGVHSQMTHLYSLIEMAEKQGVGKVYIHAILDGRDTPPESGADYISQVQAFIQSKNTVRIASVCGRYYAMDRDTRWDRTEKAYRLYTRGEGEKESDPVEAVKNAYSRGQTDEFVMPVIITGPEADPVPTVEDGDAIIFFNFRPDRARQITRAFTEKDFDKFDRSEMPDLSSYTCMTQYDESFGLPVAFGPVHLTNILGGVVSRSGLHQLRLAETEKYAHVTYFLNGGEELPFENEDRKMIPSPREIRTYDEKPEMSAPEVADEAVKQISSGKYDLVVINFANLDMVGHTGIIEAAKRACETVDRCVEKVVGRAVEDGYSVLVTADHGNSEKMWDSGNPHTAHTLNDVPLILVSRNTNGLQLQEGVLGDIAPTILQLMGLDKPVEMTGKSLLVKPGRNHPVV